MRVVGCFLEYDGKFVLLRRLPEKPNGNTWGLPAGKVEPDESDESAVLRELYEETGYMATPDQLHYVREDDFHFEGGSVTFIVYRVILERPYEVRLEESAHSDYRWVTSHEGYDLALIPGLRLVLRLTGYV